MHYSGWEGLLPSGQPIDANQEAVEYRRFQGLHDQGITDETLLSMMEGTADELSLLDAKSYKNVSPAVIAKAYKMVNVVYGEVGAPLTKAYKKSRKS